MSLVLIVPPANIILIREAPLRQPVWIALLENIMSMQDSPYAQTALKENTMPIQAARR